MVVFFMHTMFLMYLALYMFSCENCDDDVRATYICFSVNDDYEDALLV